jgi:hypothetical protein
MTPLPTTATPGSAPLFVLGHHAAHQMAGIINRLPSLRGRLEAHFIAPDGDIDAILAQPACRILPTVQLCWEQADVGNATAKAEFRNRLPRHCSVARFPSPRLTALWPFHHPDPSLIREPQLELQRYRFVDRLADRLADGALDDDLLALAYDRMAKEQNSDLGGILAADLAAMRRTDDACDVKVADFIEHNFKRQRLFAAPPFPTGTVARHVLDQLLARVPWLSEDCLDLVRRDLDFLLTGYVDRRDELPVHPIVARHFGLAWWSPAIRYRWHGNRWTFEEYLLDYVQRRRYLR